MHAHASEFFLASHSREKKSKGAVSLRLGSPTKELVVVGIFGAKVASGFALPFNWAAAVEPNPLPDKTGMNPCLLLSAKLKCCQLCPGNLDGLWLLKMRTLSSIAKSGLGDGLDPSRQL